MQWTFNEESIVFSTNSAEVIRYLYLKEFKHWTYALYKN